MRGLGDAGQHAAARDRDGDGAGRQRLRGVRQALPGGAREGRRGGATSLDRRFGGNRCAAARPPLGRERRPDAGRHRRRREYRRPRIIGRRGLRDVVVVPQERKPGRGGRRLARPQDCDRAAGQRDARAVAGTDQAYRDGAADRRTAGARRARSRGQAQGGEIDVAFMMNSWDALVVQQLLADERVALSGFPHADAFVALYPFLNKVIVLRGVTDLARDQPPADVTLIATKTTLVVRRDLHPALQYLVLNAATEIHSRPSIFNRANEFPAAEPIVMPWSGEAALLYKSGLPFLLDYFPFWMAALLGKLIILLIPILAVLYPMMRFLPGLYDWAMRSKVLRMYGELRLLEDEI